MNRKCAKLHALFLVADTQYMPWTSNASIIIQSLKKKTIVLFIPPAANEQEKLPSPKSRFLPQGFHK